MKDATNLGKRGNEVVDVGRPCSCYHLLPADRPGVVSVGDVLFQADPEEDWFLKDDAEFWSQPSEVQISHLDAVDFLRIVNYEWMNYYC